KNTQAPKSNDIGHPVVVQIRKLARIGIIAAPISCRGSKLRKFKGRGRKMATSDRKRSINASCTKADDVGHSIVIHIRKLARIVIIAAPASGRGSKLRKLKRRCRKMTASGRK